MNGKVIDNMNSNYIASCGVITVRKTSAGGSINHDTISFLIQLSRVRRGKGECENTWLFREFNYMNAACIWAGAPSISEHKKFIYTTIL